jgi:hypothetical protein
MRDVLAILVFGVFASACGGASPGTPTAPVTSTPGTPQGTSAVSAGTLPEADALCALLTAQDWSQFGYVTGAQPDVSSDGPGSAYCVYANGLGLDVFVDEAADDAEETYRTVIENAGFADGRSVELPGADEATIDTDLGGDAAGIVVRQGRVTFTIALPSGEAAEAQLLALAAIVMQRTGVFA